MPRFTLLLAKLWQSGPIPNRCSGSCRLGTRRTARSTSGRTRIGRRSEWHTCAAQVCRGLGRPVPDSRWPARSAPTAGAPATPRAVTARPSPKNRGAGPPDHAAVAAEALPRRDVGTRHGRRERRWPSRFHGWSPSTHSRAGQEHADAVWRCGACASPFRRHKPGACAPEPRWCERTPRLCGRRRPGPRFSVSLYLPMVWRPPTGGCVVPSATLPSVPN